MNSMHTEAEQNLRQGSSPWKVALVAMLILFCIYLFLLITWRVTSPEYQPHGLLDHSVRTPADSQEWFERRKNGA